MLVDLQLVDQAIERIGGEGPLNNRRLVVFADQQDFSRRDYTASDCYLGLTDQRTIEVQP
jgi:hypothetical protein